jgi:hypothetical protein
LIVEKALKVAGPGSVLAARPAGVAHVYTGPLTPSGRFIPRTGQTVCRARTRRLHVVAIPPRWSSLLPEAADQLPRLCARCSTCLARRRTFARPRRWTPRPGRSSSPSPADQYRAAYADTSPGRSCGSPGAVVADCRDELAVVGHLVARCFTGGAPATGPTPLHPAAASCGRFTRSSPTSRRVLAPDAFAIANHTRAAEYAEKARGRRAAQNQAARDAAQRLRGLNPNHPGAPR